MEGGTEQQEGVGGVGFCPREPWEERPRTGHRRSRGQAGRGREARKESPPREVAMKPGDP